jgi:hypothetical protein
MKYLDFIKQEMAVIMDRDPAIKSKMEVFLSHKESLLHRL